MNIPPNRQIFIARHPERCQTMAEILRSVASESCPGDQRGASCPGEIREENDLEKQAPARGSDTVSCTLRNDLKVAVEAKLGEESEWQTTYPGINYKMAAAVNSMDAKPQLSVRLRDDRHVCGMRLVVQGSTLRLSNSFGDFGHRAANIAQKEAKAAEKESRLRKHSVGAEIIQVIRWRRKWVMISLCLCMLMVLTAMISCTGAAFNHPNFGLALVLLLLFACAGFGVGGIGAVGGGTLVKLAKKLEADDDWSDLSGIERRYLTLLSSFCCVPLVSLGCLVAMTVAFGQNGSGDLSAVLWSMVALLICCGGIKGWREEDGSWGKKAGRALAVGLRFPFTWPNALLKKCGCGIKGLVELVVKPPKLSKDSASAIHTTHESTIVHPHRPHTIVFEGNVLPKRDTVCSWPGKYATAWDTLVTGSRQDDISAAVVFLPKGSKHYGVHDPIPARQNLQDLRGDCWCTPLYGERKPWGCRWWSKWIANIELAVSQECTLVVYYFNGMKGQGKVKDFTTAGKEHVRRESIFRCKDAFLQSDRFQNAAKAGLGNLSKEPGPDSSSPLSRELHRLFLAWLPEKEAQFLEASEGLGNSQKAEVAWLERNGFPFIEKEISELESSSPKAIGRATG